MLYIVPVKKNAEKIRLDKLLLDRGLAPSRERAQALILAGSVLVDEQKVSKSGVLVSSSAALRLLGEGLKYVSRGGLKLERALDHWGLAPERDKIQFRILGDQSVIAQGLVAGTVDAA